MMAVIFIIAWDIGAPIGFVDTSVGRDMMLFPIFGCSIFFPVHGFVNVFHDL